VAGAEHATAWAPSFLRDVHVPQGQWDALCAGCRAVKAGAGRDVEAIERLARSPHWGGGARNPVPTRLLPLDVGDRPRARAPRVAQQVVQGLAPGWGPLFLTDGCQDYTTARLPP
jgi:hypothetical protein